MKTAVCVALAVATVLVLWLGPLIWAGSSGEIVTLTTTDAKGAADVSPENDGRSKQE